MANTRIGRTLLGLPLEEWAHSKLLIRESFAFLLWYSGVNSVFRFLRRRGEGIILMYHRVVDPEEVKEGYLEPGMYVTRSVFDLQMHYLSTRYQVVGLEELTGMLQRDSPLPRNICAITFDDGWKDNYTNAFPILKKYKLPATVFLISDYIGTRQTLWEQGVANLLAQYIKSRGMEEAGEPSWLDEIGFNDVMKRRFLTREQKIRTILVGMKGVKEEKRDLMIEELRRLTGSAPSTVNPVHEMLTWDDIEEMSAAGISFGSHSKSHSVLTAHGQNRLEEEIVESRRSIERHLGRRCWAFCYPYGSWNSEVRRIVQKHYACAVTATHGFIKVGDQLGSLKRIGIHNDVTHSQAMFACKITGLLP